eukprot:gene209-biopygen17
MVYCCLVEGHPTACVGWEIRSQEGHPTACVGWQILLAHRIIVAFVVGLSVGHQDGDRPRPSLGSRCTAPCGAHFGSVQNFMRRGAFWKRSKFHEAGRILEAFKIS